MTESRSHVNSHAPTSTTREPARVGHNWSGFEPEVTVDDMEINGTRLAYAEQGTGQAVVFVHGNINDLRVWKGQLATFGSEYRAVTVSSRHYHPNEEIPDDVDLSLDTLVEDLATFLRELDLAPAHLVGSSSGAYVCLLLAQREPDLVRSLVLAEPPVLSMLGVSSPPKPFEVVKLLVRSPTTGLEVVKLGARGISPALRAFAQGDDEKGLRLFTRAVLRPEAAANLSDFMDQQIHDNVRPLEAQLRSGFPPFGEGDARSIDVPTLFVTAEHSASFQHRISDKLVRSLPRAERLDIRDASHLMFDDRAEEFNTGVLRFLEQNRG